MNRKVMIGNLLAQIGERDKEEAFRSIESIEHRPHEAALKIRFNISTVARMTARATGNNGEFVFEADGMKPATASVEDVIAALRRFMYDLDERLSEGYRQPPPKARVMFSPPPPPSWMDVPVWDEASKTWYDAEC